MRLRRDNPRELSARRVRTRALCLPRFPCLKLMSESRLILVISGQQQQCFFCPHVFHAILLKVHFLLISDRLGDRPKDLHS